MLRKVPAGDVLPWTIHECQGGSVPPRKCKEDCAKPVETIPMEEDWPEPLDTRGAVVAEEEEWDKEKPEQDRNYQSLRGGLHTHDKILQN